MPAIWNDHHFLGINVVTWWRHQMETFSRYWPFVRGIHRSPVNSPHKGRWRGALMFSLICVWINGWVNNREAADLGRHRVHYDVIVVNLPGHTCPWVISVHGTRHCVICCDNMANRKLTTNVMEAVDKDKVHQWHSNEYAHLTFEVSREFARSCRPFWMTSCGTLVNLIGGHW